ncbi:ABC transporter ATP-binding protein [Aureimonas altamirensis]|uniref:ABC transporter ATP-binding protein n=1 Tax=Aureimonas altamirensis TaxID=370622 RepID=UPI000689672D|nr:ABC transporter ATP-binding protein [Aureimonas altamirensis]
MAATSGSTGVRLNELRKHFGAFQALRGLSLDVPKGQFLTLLGPSGCGKTTTLKIIAGLLAQDGGEIHFGERRVDTLPPNRRNIGLVFQNYALFPHMTVSENIAFGLRMRRKDSKTIEGKVAELLSLVRLEGLGDRKPEQLSGGQQQRVAVARALAFDPDLVLLDEPLSNLDAKLREEVRLDLRNIQRAANQTTIFVTHDQTEALVMSDRIALMHAGEIEQYGSPRDIYEKPATEFAARFIGSNNLVAARAVFSGSAVAAIIDDSGAMVRCDTVAADIGAEGQTLYLCIRPEQVRIASRGRVFAGDLYTGRVKDVVFQGTSVLIDLESRQFGLLRSECPADEAGGITIGDDADFYIAGAHAVSRKQPGGTA